MKNDRLRVFAFALLGMVSASALGCSTSEVVASPATEATPPAPADAGSAPLPPLQSGYVDVQPLRTLDPAGPVNELASLRSIAGDAQMLGLGEHLHGSAGDHAAQARVTAYLVEQLGVRAIGVELDDATVSPANDCSLDPKSVVQQWGKAAGLEMVRLVEWVCRYNAQHAGDPVHWYGTDIWMGPEDVRALTTWAKATLSAEDADLIAKGLSHCYGAEVRTGLGIQMGWDRPKARLVEEHNGCVAALDFVDGWNDALPTAPPEAKISSVRLRGHELFYFGPKDFRRHYDARDDAQAALAELIRDARFPKARTVLIAHNAHVAYRRTVFETQAFTSMGQRLRGKLGDGYRAIAVTAHHGGYHGNLDGVPESFAYEQSGDVEQQLHALGHAAAVVDFEPIDEGKRFLDPKTSTSLGGERLVLAHQFSGLVFVDESKAEELYQPKKP